MAEKHQRIRFQLDISYDQYLAVYEGHAKTVIAMADDGRRIQFPAGKIQRYLGKTGIQGYFEMLLTEENKFVAIRKLSE